MSALLWKLYLEDDVGSFLQLLDDAPPSARTNAPKPGIPGLVLPSGTALDGPSSLSKSPSSILKSRSVPHKSPTALRPVDKLAADVPLSRGDINRRDSKGLTILHHAASSTSDSSKGFALALISHPNIDLYLQDRENGWTALHRAFYFGNITIARAIIEREARLALEHGPGSLFGSTVELMKVKDKDGLGPYDVLATTIPNPSLQTSIDARGRRNLGDAIGDDADSNSHSSPHRDGDDLSGRMCVSPRTNVHGDELLAFGSNRNFSLGFSDEDERHFPERVVLRRPKHLFQRFFREQSNARASRFTKGNPALADKLRPNRNSSPSIAEIPATILAKTLHIQDVQMAKFHTAVLTNDPCSNLYICGHGLGGRLGTGNENTQFNFVCLEDFGNDRKKFVSVALGQDHSLAVSDRGEMYAWGTNTFGQLGCGLPRPEAKPSEFVQVSPKQIFGPLKKELIIGVAASRIHSVAYTENALFIWGKNNGQLGLVDAQAGSVKIQPIPRQVAASRFSCDIGSVSAIERATVCLLENHEVHVFANYGAVKLQIPLDGFSNYFLKSSFLTTKHNATPNKVCKVTGGGDTICALSTSGQVFTITVNQRLDPGSTGSASTTNPNKIKAALSTPNCVWSLKKDDMAARDVAVDHDGSVILSTEAGSVWRRIRRQRGNSASGIGPAREYKAKDFKYLRVPNLTRAVAVRASASGGWMAIKQDCDVTRHEIAVEEPKLWEDIFSMLPIRSLLAGSEEELPNPPVYFWRRPHDLTKLIARIAQAEDIEADFDRFSRNTVTRGCDIYLSTTTSLLRIPLHSFLLAARSGPMRSALAEFTKGHAANNEVFHMSRSREGAICISLQGFDFLTALELVLYLYTDSLVGFWQQHHVRRTPAMGPRYRQVRVDLMKLGARLELRNLESAARKMMSNAEPSLAADMELAIMDASFFQECDVMIQLSNGELPMHIALASKRCPFFEGLFQGHTNGRWLSERRSMSSSSRDMVDVDLGHVEIKTFRLVLRHLYADSGEELFDHVVAEDLDDFLDTVMDVLSVANELMLDRLSQICQVVLGRYVNLRNACQLLNAVAPSSVTEFKDSCLEYLCLNLEPMLCNHLLDDLDDDLLSELDDVVRSNQSDMSPFARSGHAENALLEKYPDLAASIHRNRQAKLDAIGLQSKLLDQSIPLGTSLNDRDQEKLQGVATQHRRRPRPSAGSSPPTTPALTPALRAEAAASRPNDQVKLPALASPADAPSQSQSSVASPTTSFGSSAPIQARPGDFPENLTPSRSSLENLMSEGRSPHSPVLNTLSASSSMQSPGIARPWGPSLVPTKKLDMKEIMTQTSASRKSNISLGLQSQRDTHEGQSPQHHARLSQKERKKQQQQKQSIQTASAPRTTVDTSRSETSNRAPSSPWKAIPVSKKASVAERAHEVSSSREEMASASEFRSKTAPQLTMRQTLANSPASRANELAMHSQSQRAQPLSHVIPTTPPVKRNISQGSTSNMLSTDSKTPVVQSIRHNKRPQDSSNSSFPNQSMTSIISQEQAGKDALKDAIAKRSLQEIQQEQEFQASAAQNILNM